MDHPKCEATGKRIHRSKQGARRAVKRIGNRVRIYVCRECGGYHITDSEKSVLLKLTN